MGLINMHIDMALLRPQTSPCLILEDKYTGWRSCCIAYWWVWLDRMAGRSETREPSRGGRGWLWWRWRCDLAFLHYHLTRRAWHWAAVSAGGERQVSGRKEIRQRRREMPGVHRQVERSEGRENRKREGRWNLITGSWSKKENERWMERERGE